MSYFALFMIGLFLGICVGVWLGDNVATEHYQNWIIKNRVGGWYLDKKGKRFFGIKRLIKTKKK